MGKQKFYVVWKGNNPGVYQSWEKCQSEIKNVNGALFKSFASLEEAKKAYDQGYHCLLYTSPSPRDLSTSRMPSSA